MSPAQRLLNTRSNNTEYHISLPQNNCDNVILLMNNRVGDSCLTCLDISTVALRFARINRDINK